MCIEVENTRCRCGKEPIRSHCRDSEWRFPPGLTNQDWSLNTDRYVYLDGRGGRRAFQPGGERDTPRDDSREPLPIPSISWWWRHDPGGPATVRARLPVTATVAGSFPPGGPTGFGTTAVHIARTGSDLPS